MQAPLSFRELPVEVFHSPTHFAVQVFPDPGFAGDELQPTASGPEGVSEERNTKPVLGWRAVAGLDVRIHAVAGCGQDDAKRQIQFLSHVLAHPPESEWALQMQLLGWPTQGLPKDDWHPLQLRFICAASGVTETSAARRVRDFAASVALAGKLLYPLFELLPIDNADSLAQRQAPFEPADIVEVRRPLTRFNDRGLDLHLPAVLPRRECTGQWLCAALVNEAERTGQVLSWTVTIEATPDLGAARRILRNVIVGSESSYRSARTRADLGLDVLAVAEAGDAAETWLVATHQCRALAGLGVRVQATLAISEGCVPVAVVAAAISDCSNDGWADGSTALTPPIANRVAAPRYSHRLLAAQRMARCVAADDQAGEFSHLADLQQAAGLFFLPVPSKQGLPGLPLSPEPHQVWLVHPARRSQSTGPTDALTLGENIAIGRRQLITLSLEDRRRHLYVIGQTGVGKSTALLNYIHQDLDAGRGLAVFDPHGDLISAILRLIPEWRRDEVVLLDPSDRDRPVGFNMLECADEDERHLVAEGVIGIMYKLFDPNYIGIVGPRFEHAVRNAILTATCLPNMTLVEVVRVLTDPTFVRKVLPAVQDPLVRRYWTDQIANTSDFHKSEVLDYIVSKFSPFVHNPLVRNIIGQGHSTFSLRRVMDEGKILLVNLAQGSLGPKLATFLGMVLMPKLLTAALSRGDTPEEERRDFSLYVDEFQNYASPVFIEMLSGARKYRMNITMAHQHIGQIPRDVRQAILGNVGTIVAMRVGVEDANVLADAMKPSEFHASDFLELPNYRAIAQVLTDGRKSPCFSLATLPPPDVSDETWGQDVRERARTMYGRPRAEVEREIGLRADL